MCQYKQKCPQCKEWFMPKNGNREYCVKCRPPDERYIKKKLYED